ncbi:MAG: hypothetical protein AB1390_11165 [Nitrospirota bacterium]
MNLIRIIFVVGLLTLSGSVPAVAEDPCENEGLVVKNLSFTNLWYTKSDGSCTIWQRDHIFTIKPNDKVQIFSDLICKTSYCGSQPAYDDYRSMDADGDCRVRILPGCTISDM